MNNFISIDPSGMGKNGFFTRWNNIYDVRTIINETNWLDTFNNNKGIISMYDEVYIEDIKYTFAKVGRETITTIKLIAAIESYCLQKNIKCITVTSDQVKSRAKWFKTLSLIQTNKKGLINKRDQKKIDFCNLTGIKWKKNKYFYQGNKINAHERDAILIYYIGKE